LREISNIVIFYKVALYQIEEDKLLPLFPLNNKIINAFAMLLIIAMILTILSERDKKINLTNYQIRYALCSSRRIKIYLTRCGWVTLRDDK